MVSNAQIISDLRVMHEAKHKLELLTIFKGVPFICKAEIEAVKDDAVNVKAEDPCLVCLLHEKKLRVLGSDYFEPSVATVVSLDIKSGEIELSNFSYVGTKLGARMIVRVEPKEVLPVTLKNEEETIDGEMVDLSIGGMGVRIGRALYSSHLIPGTVVNISFQLPNDDINLSGTILSIIKLPGGYRLSIRFDQNGSQKISIFRYLVDRRAEIEQELFVNYKTTINNT